jgi:hypothetical protein
MICHYHSIRLPLANFLNGARSKSVPSQEALYIRARLVVEEIVMTSKIGIIQTDPFTAGVRVWGFENFTAGVRAWGFEMISYILAQAIFKVPIWPPGLVRCCLLGVAPRICPPAGEQGPSFPSVTPPPSV